MNESRHEERPPPAFRSSLLVQRPGHLHMMVREYDHPDAIALVRALFDEQIDRYGFADPAEADPAAYRHPAGAFLVGYLSADAVTCGGYRSYRTGPSRRSVEADAHHGNRRTVEVKKMYTAPGHRGRGYGRAVLAALESLARETHATAVILETGVRNTAALGLYRSAGYRPTVSYVPGRDPAINRAFTKTFDLSPRSSARRALSPGPSRE